MENKKFAVILAGCGARDGSEIHETTMTLLALARHGVEYAIFAPDDDQYEVVNHLTGETMKEKRNMLVEAARIARGNISALDKFNPADFDALILPGGFGVAKNLFTYAFDGVNAKVRPDVAAAIREMYDAHKPIGALCISPILLVKVLKNLTITVGNDEQTAHQVELMGSKNINTKQTEVLSDKENMVFTTPCYMLPATIADIADCADNLVSAVLENI